MSAMLAMLLTTRILAVFEWLRGGDPQALIAEGKVDGEGGMLSRGYTRVEILQRAVMRGRRILLTLVNSSADDNVF